MGVKDAPTSEEIARERVKALLYLLMRDLTPTGILADLVERLTAEEFKFSSQELEALAARYTQTLFSTEAGGPVPARMREWVDGFPERIKESPHFRDVLREAEELEQLGALDERTRLAVVDEVRKRDR